MAQTAAKEVHEVDDDLEGKSAEFSTPQRLVQLTFEAERSFTY